MKWIIYIVICVFAPAVLATLDSNGPGKASVLTNSEAQSQLNPDIINTTAEGFRQLMVDIADFYTCDYLKNRIMVISSQGAQTAGGMEPDTGILWITDCSAEEISPDKFKIDIEAIGWRWIGRKVEAVGATFELDQNVKFKVNATAVGTFDMAYSPPEHIATVYFVPTQPVEAIFDVMGDVKVQTNSLWSSIVGQAAPLVGDSLQERAKKSIREKASRTFQAKLKHGFTIIADLCTGRYYTKFGTFEPGKLPEKAMPLSEKIYEINSRGILHEQSLLMAGPFKQNRKFFARFENTHSAGFEAVWLSQSAAEKIASDYVQSGQISVDEVLEKQTIAPGEKMDFAPPKDLSSPVVLLMQLKTDEEIPADFNYAVIYPDDDKRPLVDCSE